MMDYTMLLTDDDERISTVLNKLVATHDHVLPLATLIQDTGLSPYKIRKLINTTNDDLMHLHNPARIILGTHKPTQVQLVHDSATLVPQMTVNMLDRSPLFAVFEYRFFYNNIQPKTAYMHRRFLSQTPFYHYEALLQQRIVAAPDQLDDLPNAHVESEYAIRLQLLQVYQQAYRSVRSPFPELDATTAKIATIINQVLTVNPAPSKQNLLNIFLAVWQKRLHNQDYLHDSLINPDAKTAQLLKQLEPILAIAIGPADSQGINAQRELEFVLTLLSLLEVIPHVSTLLAQPYQSDAERMTAAFLKCADQSVPPTISMNHQQLRDSLMLINVKFLILHLNPDSFNTDVGHDFFVQAYPVFDRLILQFIPELTTHLHLRISASDASVLYHH